jgi:hypothetical protein
MWPADWFARTDVISDKQQFPEGAMAHSAEQITA